MSLDTKERPGFTYNPDDDSNNKPSGKGSTEGDLDFNKSWDGKGVKKDYNPSNPASKKNDVANAEKNPSIKDGAGVGGLNNAENSLTSTAGKLGKGFTGAGAAGAKAGITSVFTKKKTAGGGIAVLIIGLFTALLVGTGSLTVINISENLRGEGNSINNSISNSMQPRRINSFTKLMTTTFKKGAQDQLTKSTAKKFASEGFIVVMEKGVIKSLSKGEGASKVILTFDGSNKNITKQIAGFAGGTPLEKEFMKSFDNVTRESVSRLSGIVTRKRVHQRLGIVAFFDWIGAARVTEETATDGSSWRRSLFRASQEQKIDQLKLQAALEAGRITQANTAGEVLTETKVSENAVAGAEEAKKVAKEGGYQELIIDGEAEANALAANADEAGELLEAGGSATKEAGEQLGKKIGGRIGGTLLTAAGSVDPSTPVRLACDARGQIQFVKNARNTLMAINLAVGAANYFTVADHQKAGILEESSLKLMSLYVAGATGCTGFQNVISKGRVPVATAGLEKYGIGYADVGLLAAVATFIQSVPGLGPETCRFVQNPLAQVGTTIVGGLVTAASGGTLAGVNLGWSIGLAVAKEVAFTIATPLLIRSSGGLVIDYFENEIDAGDALVAGDGVIKAMTANANGGLGATNELFQQQIIQADQLYQEKLAQKSIFARYLDVNQPDSLVTKVALMSPGNINQAGSKMQTYMGSGPFGRLASIASTITLLILLS